MKNLCYVFGLMGALFFASCDKDATSEIVETEENTKEFSRHSFGWDYNYELASTTEELNKLMSDPNVNIVRNEQDFKRFTQAEPLLREVFSNERLYKEVVSSMRFNRRGLKTYSSKALRKAYPNKFRVILIEMSKGFGMDLWLAADYEGYACTSTATCTTETFAICIGANC